MDRVEMIRQRLKNQDALRHGPDHDGYGHRSINVYSLGDALEDMGVLLDEIDKLRLLNDTLIG